MTEIDCGGEPEVSNALKAQQMNCYGGNMNINK